jgi:hypothetical protein
VVDLDQMEFKVRKVFKGRKDFEVQLAFKGIKV